MNLRVLLTAGALLALAFPCLAQQPPAFTNNWLKFKLVGANSNRSAIGAKVRLQATIGGQTIWQMREVNVGGGNGVSQLDPQFGLGDATNAQTVLIEWPSGVVQELKQVPAGQVLKITEPVRLEPAGPRQFTIRCWQDLVFIVHASTDLSSWTGLGTITNLNGTNVTYTDPNTELSQRMYRVQAQ